MKPECRAVGAATISAELASASMAQQSLVGKSPSFLRALSLVRRCAQYDAPVLIEGETGTGKELAARDIHYTGLRRGKPFIPANCGALPDNLVQNELFGHQRGAYTGADRSSLGLLQLAHGGTLFLDEVDSLGPVGQVALLRFLQDQVVRALGAEQELRVDVRIIAASNRNLSLLAQNGAFRLDLFHRLRVLSVELPPLRERPEDLLQLALKFIEQTSVRYDVPQKPIHPQFIKWMEAYQWPGNVRELQNLICREMLLGEGTSILAECAKDAIGEPMEYLAQLPRTSCYREAKSALVTEFNRKFVVALLERNQGNISRAAREAGKERREFARLVQAAGITPSKFRVPVTGSLA